MKVTKDIIEKYKSIALVNPKNTRQFFDWHEDENNREYWWEFTTTNDSLFLPIPKNKIIDIINKQQEQRNWRLILRKNIEDYDGEIYEPKTNKGYKTTAPHKSLVNAVERMI